MKENKMISKDLIPRVFKQKKTGHFGYFNIWVGLAVILATFEVGGEAIVQINLEQTIIAGIVGCLALSVLITFGGDIGTEHGISYPTYMRVIFGEYGMTVMNVVRVFYGAMWFGIQTYYGAIAINIIVRTWTGYDNWMLWFWVFLLFQAVNTACGFSAIEKFANIAGPAILLIGVYMVVRMGNIAQAEDIQLFGRVLDSDLSSGGAHAFIYIAILNMCYWADGATDVETWTREVKTVKGERGFWKRNKYTLLGHFAGLTIAETFMVVIGAISMIVFGNSNPVEAIEAMTQNPIVLAILLLMVILAQWSTNNTANLLPGALCLTSLTRGKIKYGIAVFIVAVLGFAIQPWIIYDHIATFLTVIGSIWSSVFGLTLADYFLIRKRRMNIPDLYDVEKGQFCYKWNWAGVITIIVSLIACYFGSDYSIFVGLGVSFICYSLLATKWWFKKYPQAEMTATGDELRGTSANMEWRFDAENNRVYAANIDDPEDDNANAAKVVAEAATGVPTEAPKE